MIDYVLMLTTIICIGGIWFGEVPIGIIFVLSLIGFLYCLITLVTYKLNELGMLTIIGNSISLAYSVFYVFMGIDLLIKLGLK